MNIHGNSISDQTGYAKQISFVLSSSIDNNSIGNSIEN